MAKPSTSLTSEQRDSILLRSVVYHMTQAEISKSTGFSSATISRTLGFYWAVKEKNWEKLAQLYCDHHYNLCQPENVGILQWAEKASGVKIPTDVLDCLRTTKEKTAPKEPKAAEKPTADKIDRIIEQNDQILSCLRAITDGMPQILTAISYLDKRVKDESKANFEPLMGYIKTINENLVGVKCNTRLLKNLEGK